MITAQEIARHMLLQSDAIKNVVKDRVYYTRIPDRLVIPAITIKRLAASESTVLKGGSGRIEATLEIRCLAANEIDATDLAHLAKDTLEGDRPKEVNETALRIQMVRCSSWVNEEQEIEDGSDAPAFDVESIATTIAYREG